MHARSRCARPTHGVPIFARTVVETQLVAYNIMIGNCELHITCFRKATFPAATAEFTAAIISAFFLSCKAEMRFFMPPPPISKAASPLAAQLSSSLFSRLLVLLPDCCTVVYAHMFWFSKVMSVIVVAGNTHVRTRSAKHVRNCRNTVTRTYSLKHAAWMTTANT